MTSFGAAEQAHRRRVEGELAMRRIRYTHKRNRGCWGKAFTDEWRIEIDPGPLEDKTHMDLALHEGLHVLFPDLDEDTVNCAGATLADLLFRLGYRREHEDE